MAKKKNSEVVEEGQESKSLKEIDIFSKITKEIESDLGRGIIVSGNEIIERPRTIIPVSPSIDQVLNGGIPEGSWVVLSGKPKTGKTTTALHFAKKCQLPAYDNRNIYYLNVEGRLKKRDIIGAGLNPSKLKVIESNEDNILSSQQFLSIAQKILYADKKCVLIIDSISALCDEREIVGGVGTETRGSGARWVSQFASQMANVVPIKGNIVIGIMHLMNNTSGYGDAWVEKGGNAIQYQADVKLRVKEVKLWSATQDSEPFGQIVTWKCGSSALGPPHRQCQSYIRYGEGIDEVTELIIDATDIGLINVAGSWYSCDFLANHPDMTKITEWNAESIKQLGGKVQGQEKLRRLLLEKSDWFDALQKDLKGML